MHGKTSNAMFLARTIPPDKRCAGGQKMTNRGLREDSGSKTGVLDVLICTVSLVIRTPHHFVKTARRSSGVTRLDRRRIFVATRFYADG